MVFGLGTRGYIYASFAKKYPEKFDLVAIIDNAPQKAKFAAEESRLDNGKPYDIVK